MREETGHCDNAEQGNAEPQLEIEKQQKSNEIKSKWHPVRFTYVVIQRQFFGGQFDGNGDETEHGADPQQNLETAEHGFDEAHPFGRSLDRR